MQENIYAGLLPGPDVDFRAVRDFRRARPLWQDIDLSTARSVSAGTHLVLNIAGDSFYADANPSDGVALVHFQDTNLDRTPAPLYVGPGAIFNVPFTQVLVENTAQAGKKLRIFYGVGLDFQPGSIAALSIAAIPDNELVRAVANQDFVLMGTVGAVAGARIDLQNPVGSGKTVTVKAIYFTCSVACDMSYSAILGTSGLGFLTQSVRKNDSATAGVSLLQGGTGTVPNSFSLYGVPANTPQVYVPRDPIVLVAGSYLAFGTGAASAIKASYEVLEQ